MDTYLKAIILTSLNLVLGASAYAADTSPLIRLTDPDDLLGWEAVGRLEINKDSYCTGTLISTDLVLTAAHCVYNQQSGVLIEPQNFTFKAGLIDGKMIESVEGTRVVAHKSYNHLSGLTPENIQYDAALIQLRTPISSYTASPFKLHSGVSKGNQISVVSYGQGRDNALSLQRECTVLGRRYGLLAFNCDVTYGSSGAPVFAIEKGNNRILSLISGGITLDGQRVSFGMDLSKVVPQLKRDIGLLYEAFE